MGLVLSAKTRVPKLECKNHTAPPTPTIMVNQTSFRILVKNNFDALVSALRTSSNSYFFKQHVTYYVTGLFASFCGGLSVGIFFYLGVIFGVQNLLLLKSSSQIPIIFVGGIGGLLGSVLDSFLGALCQFSSNGQV